MSDQAMLREGGDTYQLAINLQIPKTQKGLNVHILKRNKPKAFIHPISQSNITVESITFPNWGKITHALGCDTAHQSANEQLCCMLCSCLRMALFRLI